MRGTDTQAIALRMARQKLDDSDVMVNTTFRLPSRLRDRIGKYAESRTKTARTRIVPAQAIRELLELALEHEENGRWRR